MHHVDERFLQTEGGGQEGKMHFLLLFCCFFKPSAGRRGRREEGRAGRLVLLIFRCGSSAFPGRALIYESPHMRTFLIFLASVLAWMEHTEAHGGSGVGLFVFYFGITQKKIRFQVRLCHHIAMSLLASS
mgnify:CR=1 FL=1